MNNLLSLGSNNPVASWVSKDEALVVCRNCSNAFKKVCILADIEAARESVLNPPECLRRWLKMSFRDCQLFMHGWYEKCCPAFDIKTIDYKIKRIYSMIQPYPPCGLFKNVGLCGGL